MENPVTQHASRPPNPPHSHAPSDIYNPKRASYRRPIDPQPTPPQRQPVPLEHGAFYNSSPTAPAAAPNGPSRATSHRRRHSHQLQNAQAEPQSLLPAPDAPRGPPPTSYRDPYSPRGSSRSHSSPRSYAPRPRDPTLQMNPSRQQPSIQIAPDRLRSPAEPASSGLQGQLHRPSVPDRSPLQKLEGKLDDISKEEMRMRVQEAELEAQERAEAEARARRALQAAVKQQRNVSGPVYRQGPSAEPHLHRRRHVSMPPQAPQTVHVDELDGSDEDPAYDLSEPWDPTGASLGALHARIGGLAKSASQRQNNRESYVERRSAPAPQTDLQRADSLTLGSGGLRSHRVAPQGLDGTYEAQTPVRRKPVAAPAGLGLSGVNGPQPEAVPPAQMSRNDNKTTKHYAHLSTNVTNNHGRKRDSRGISAAQMEMAQDRIDHKTSARVMPPLQPHDASLGHRRARRDTSSSSSSRSSSDDGAERRYRPSPMLQEWKDAPVAVLKEEDLDLDVPKPIDDSNKAWWEEGSTSRRRRSFDHTIKSHDGYVDEGTGQTGFNPPLYLKCGPLLRYTGIRRDKSRPGKEREVWRGSIMIVTQDDQSSYSTAPTLRLFKQPKDLLPPPPAEIDSDGQPLNPAYVDPLEGQTKMSRIGQTLYVKPVDEIPENFDYSRVEDDRGLFQTAPIKSALDRKSKGKSSRSKKKDGEQAGKVREIPGIRLHAEHGVTFWRFNLEVELGSSQTRVAYRINRGPAVGFWVPAKGETMNIMFHSCNGFSHGVDSNEFCGPDPLWRDVLNSHQTQPFHVMIGGGDQIYNDAVVSETKLFGSWLESRNPLQKHKANFSPEMQEELENFYLNRYSMWFSQGFFAMANSQIPMVNIWDDHDIIDGFGSYPHHFMTTPVFSGLGAVAYKYYLLFQHQSIVAETEKTEPSWLLGAQPGPYIRERSRSVFVDLGKHVAFLGLDCRTERRREQVLSDQSYDLVFSRLEDQIVKGETKHLIVLLGVPIAYPRLNFLENILTSRLMDPIKAAGRAGLLGNFVNKFTGDVEILDDLDDHWTARHHKAERNWLIQELQHVAATKSVRITILSGDVHLGAVGQFYSAKQQNALKVPRDKDHRYMPNIISSAIVNTPPAAVVADTLNRRNKVHHLDPFTDEEMIPIFQFDVPSSVEDDEGKRRKNTHLMARRNWCTLREYLPGTTPPGTPTSPKRRMSLTRTLSDSAPGKMVRRLSGAERRGRDRAPPVSYYNNPANAAASQSQPAVQSSFSPDREEPRRSRRNSLTSLFRRRMSTDSVAPPATAQSVPAGDNRNSYASGEDRPSPFHRRSSVLGRKGLKAEGDYINLQGGLDITLHMEVSQKDPAGITHPYRLLVPALQYEPPAPDAVEKERRKSRLGSIFAFGPRRRTMAEDDDRSYSGASVISQGDGATDTEDEERGDQTFTARRRSLIARFTRRRTSASQADGAPPDTDYRPSSPQARREQQYDSPVLHATKGNQHNHRHVSAPLPASATTYNTTPGLPTSPAGAGARTSIANSPRQPMHMHNSSHRSQLPASSPSEEPKVYRRSMGGILNQQRDPAWEHEVHNQGRTPQQRKRESYPPHPAVVGAGPGGPYSRGAGGGVEPRDNSVGGYFAGNHHHHHGSGSANYGGYPGGYPGGGNAGVGARYLGGGRYAGGEESEGEYSDELGEEMERESKESFVPPKTRSRWKIWKN
ncbi:hypothetical protein M011DRAFT_474311 [Sporormia fimetaria CBS 119925]|uniref:PhoD-like phosphatase domain-containing protein n=1 Tax=Sporormia fimetaria CBS 119925 TaxID=1340428 RepID=A0A6A6VM58_9PLEO|nr:hypothetical protein M011DRAFT_474311 [Sporormia fimetaria CBS 119925]